MYQLLLDYCASEGEAVVTCKANKMEIAMHSDASYYMKPKKR